MLVLTRKKNEVIQIGQQIVIKVISTGRGKVKLGIDAPANIRVLRAELAKLVPATTPTVEVELATH
jgi:carbon storage regulator